MFYTFLYHKKTPVKKFGWIFFILFFVFNFYPFLPVRAQIFEETLEDFLKAEEEYGNRAKFEVEFCLEKREQLKKEAWQKLSKKEQLQKAREQEDAKKKAVIESKEVAVFAREAQLQKRDELEIAEKKASIDANKQAALDRKAKLKKECEQKAAKKQAAIDAKKKPALDRKKAALDKKKQLRKEHQLKKEAVAARIRADKEAAKRDLGAPDSSLGVEYMCELGVSSYKSGRYLEALSEFDKVLLVEPNNQIAQKYARKILKKLEREKKMETGS